MSQLLHNCIKEAKEKLHYLNPLGGHFFPVRTLNDMTSVSLIFLICYNMGLIKEGLPLWLSGKESAYHCRRLRFDLWVGKIPWRRKWQPTPVFLPKNPMDRGAWQATVHGIAKSGS